eukprot:gene39682-48315_t
MVGFKLSMVLVLGLCLSMQLMTSADQFGSAAPSHAKKGWLHGLKDQIFSMFGKQPVQSSEAHSNPASPSSEISSPSMPAETEASAALSEDQLVSLSEGALLEGRVEE